MKKTNLLLFAFSVIALGATAQTDSTSKSGTEKPRTGKTDSIRIGNILIIQNEESDSSRTKSGKKTTKTYSVNWFTIDLGFSNFSDKTNYAQTEADGLTGAGVGEEQMTLRTGKSVNINLWFYEQRFDIVKKRLSVKYSVGVELNNYRFRENVVFEKSPNQIVMDPTKHYSKNKLATDYVTVPVVLSYNFTPHSKHKVALSAGASVGYLYSARQKTITAEGGKNKVRDDFNLRPFKISYVGELALGPLKFYGSYATQSIFRKGLDITPYNVGLRFGGL